jgi:hypothetical protein
MRALRVGLAALALLAVSVAGGKAATALPAAAITVSTVFPSSLPTGASFQDVFVSGSGFVDGDKVSFGTGVKVHSVSIEGADQMTVSVSVTTTAALTTRDVVITNGTVSGTCPGCFAVSDTPVVSAVNNQNEFGTPASLPQRSLDQTLTVSGADFMPGATVSFGAGSGVAVSAVNYQGPSALQVTVSVSAKAPIQPDVVTVTNKAAGSPSGNCTTCFSVSDTPSVQSLSAANTFVIGPPGSALTLPQGASLQQLFVAGTSFMPGATVSFGAGSGVAVSSVAYDSSTQLEITVSVSRTAPLQNDVVTVTNKATGSPNGNCATCFTVSDTPTVASLSSNGPGPGGVTALPQGASLQSFAVEGTDFMPKATVSFGAGSGITVSAVAYEGPSELLITVSVSATALLQSYDVTVTNKAVGSGSGVCTACFTVSDTPTVFFVLAANSFTSASTLPQGAAFQTFDIEGTDFMPKATVSFGAGSGVTVNAVAYQGPGQLEVTVSVSATALLQSDDVTVTNKAGNPPNGTCFGCFTVSDTPAIFGGPGSPFSPGTADNEIDVFGSNFQSDATVSFSPGTGITVNAVRYEGTSELVINFSVDASAPAQTDDLTVTNPTAPTPNSATQPGFLIIG